MRSSSALVRSASTRRRWSFAASIAARRRLRRSLRPSATFPPPQQCVGQSGPLTSPQSRQMVGGSAAPAT